MKVKVYPGFAKGKMEVPPSKSLLHRSIICACMAKGKSIIRNIVMSEDIKATINAFKTMGVKIEKLENSLEIRSSGILPFFGDEIIDCKESGSTIRFLMPLFANKKGIYFTGKESLLNRPFTIYEDIFKKNDVIFEKINNKIHIQNELQGNTYEVLGNVSSQFISGLLFSLPLKKSDSIIKVIGKLESKKYVDMTISVLQEFGINISERDNTYYIKGNQIYVPANYKVESDYSQLAFFAVAGIVNGDITIQNINTESLQPDFEIINLIEKMGGEILKQKNSYTFIKSKTNGINIDLSQHPDIAPILSILAAVSKGKTHFENARRLRYKETDRLKAISENLNLLGVKYKVINDNYTVEGQNILQGNSFSSYNDHRMVMSVAIAALRANSPITIEGAEAVNKSYPDFFEDLKSLGIRIEYL